MGLVAGRPESLRLMGWRRSRRVVVLRRRLKGSLAVSEPGDGNQLRLSFAEIGEDTAVWEYAVLVISLDEEVLSIARLYRDRADCENAFDKLKNQRPSSAVR